MELSDTIELMVSSDWKARLKAEYWQARIRFGSLCDYIESDDIMNDPDGGMDLLLLTTQRDIMYSYLTSLYNRIIVLGLDQYVDDVSDIAGWTTIYTSEGHKDDDRAQQGI